MWKHRFEDARGEYVATAAAVSAFEPVTMIVDPADVEVARAALPSAVEIVELSIDDSWFRDSGPIFTLRQGAAGPSRAGVDFGFNAWGEKFAPWDADATVTERLLGSLGEQRRASPMIFEGGSLTVDGRGTLITTEQCALNPNRNPDMSREEIGAELGRMLGVSSVIWLPWGFAEDVDTDGHVDGVCAFAAPGVVLAQACADRSNANHTLMEENREVLAAAVDAAGRSLEVIEIPHITYFEFDGDPYRNSYLNFYVANGGVVVPLAADPRDNHPNDVDAMSIIAIGLPRS